MKAVLLDTCAVIWLAEGSPIAAVAMAAILEAASADGVLVSPVSAWEAGLLSAPRGNRPPMRFLPDAKTWFARVLAGPGIRPAPFTPGIAIDAAHLPGALHGDPADRLLAATARDMGVRLITRDSRLLDYAAAGHLRALRA